jgi:peptide-methionine (S)-S-oxide reductase
MQEKAMRLPTLVPQFNSARDVIVALVLVSSVLAVGARVQAANGTTAVPPPVTDAAADDSGGLQTAVFSGGCFWGVQAVFQHVRGVRSAVSGYAGGGANDAKYEIVSSGSTGHAESVKVVFDPAQISYGRLLMVFFSVAHDPTQLNRQGPDRGSQYRSAIFTTSADQKRVAESYIAQLDAARVFDSPIVTRVSPLNAFYPAEAYHQDYATLHPDNRYIVVNDAPKLVELQDRFGDLYVAKPVLVASQ